MVTCSPPAGDCLYVFEYSLECEVPKATLGDGFFSLLVDLPAYKDEELDSLTKTLQLEERELSDRRLLLQGAIDVVRAELASRMCGSRRSRGWGP